LWSNSWGGKRTIIASGGLSLAAGDRFRSYMGGLFRGASNWNHAYLEKVLLGPGLLGTKNKKGLGQEAWGKKGKGTLSVPKLGGSYSDRPVGGLVLVPMKGERGKREQKTGEWRRRPVGRNIKKQSAKPKPEEKRWTHALL